MGPRNRGELKWWILINFTLMTRNCVSKTRTFVLKMMNFAAHDRGTTLYFELILSWFWVDFLLIFSWFWVDFELIFSWFSLDFVLMLYFLLILYFCIDVQDPPEFGRLRIIQVWWILHYKWGTLHHKWGILHLKWGVLH